MKRPRSEDIITEETKWSCKDCAKIFKSRDTLRHHVVIHQKIKPFNCEQCPKTFPQKWQLNKHSKTHNVKSYKCQQCDYTSYRNHNIDLHVSRVHEQARTFVCTKCEKSFKCNRDLKMHMSTHSKEKPYECQYCGKKQASKGYHLEHVKCHGSKDYSCQECSKSFPTRSRLQLHLKIHKPKHFRCEQCDEAFVTKQGLKNHCITHTGEKSFECEHCGKILARASALIRHRKLVHSQHRPYVCGVCSQGFTEPKLLTNHERIHTGEKPFRCSECDTSFRLRTSLSRHLLTHTGVKPFVCPHCNFAFSLQSNLARHIRLHETQFTYKEVCPMGDGSMQQHVPGETLPCLIRCETKHHLDYHIQRHHTEFGIAAKFESETKLAHFFTNHGIGFDRDWTNRIDFKTCTNIEGGRSSARPDFFLTEYSAKLKVLLFTCNDEFCHRRTKCEFQRIFNIAQALEQTEEFRGLPICFIRVNPHFFRIGKRYFDPKLEDVHLKLLEILQNLKPEDIQPGVNLIFLNYDRNENNELEIFQKDEETDDFADLFRHCVRQIV